MFRTEAIRKIKFGIMAAGHVINLKYCRGIVWFQIEEIETKIRCNGYWMRSKLNIYKGILNVSNIRY